MNNIIISDSKDFEIKKKVFNKSGLDKIHFLSDFDGTLTKALYDGEKAGSLISRLRNGKYLSEEYARKAHLLFDTYHHIELDPHVSLEVKKEKMYEWWKKHEELLIEYGLDNKTIELCVEEMMKTKIPDFRSGVRDFLKLLNENKIPFIILSSSLEDLILEFFKQKKVDYGNIHVIGNEFEYEKGKAIAIKRIIHIFNKNEATLEHLPIYQELLKRKNVILLGDSIGDLGMVEGFPHDNLIKIGFLNDRIEENVEEYRKNFDVLILNDGDFLFVNEIIKSLIY